MANLKITLVKSLNGRLEKHIATAESLGLRKIGQTSIQPQQHQTQGASVTYAAVHGNARSLTD